MRLMILIVSQDPDFYLMLDHILRADSFQTKLTDGAIDSSLVGVNEAFAIILDCRADSNFAAGAFSRLKNNPETRDVWSIALVGPGAEQQHLELLKLGIDESLVRPIAPARLLHSLRSRASRTGAGHTGPAGGELLVLGELEMRLDAYRVHCAGKEVRLGSIEFNVLRHLLGNPGRVFSRDELIAAAWPSGIHVDPRTVDVHISRLRKALRTVSSRSVIRTIRSAGYALEDQGC